MPLPSSGPLSLNDIQTEFGGTNPIGLNEYYAGGGLVPAGTTGTNGAVPSSGAISIFNFYGTTNIPSYWTSGYPQNLIFNDVLIGASGVYGITSTVGSNLIGLYKFNTQTGASLWTRAHLQGGFDGRYTGAVDSAENIYLISGGTSNNPSGMNVFKFDSSGNSLYKIFLYDIGGAYGNTSVTDSSNNLYIASSHGGSGSFPGVLVKLNSSGTVQWSRVLNETTYGGNGTWVSQVAVDTSNNVYVLGSSYKNSANQYYPTIYKFDTNGNLLAVRTILLSGATSVFGTGLAIDASGNMYVTAYALSGSGFGDNNRGIITKLDSSFTKLWERQGGNATEKLYINSAGTVIVGRVRYFTNQGQPWTATAINNSGTLLFSMNIRNLYGINLSSTNVLYGTFYDSFGQTGFFKYQQSDNTGFYQTLSSTTGIYSVRPGSTWSLSSIVSVATPTGSVTAGSVTVATSTTAISTPTISVTTNAVTFSATTGSAIYTVPGTYTWIAPAGVTAVNVLAIGGGGGGAGGINGGGGGGGGGLAYRNNSTVTPGSSYTIQVGFAGTGGGVNSAGTAGTNSSFTNVVVGFGGSPGGSGNTGGTYSGTGGGSGGNGSSGAGAGGGAAGGYTGGGGQGGGPNGSGNAGAGGAGSGGPGGLAYYVFGGLQNQNAGARGGSTGIIGEGPSGVSPPVGTSAENGSYAALTVGGGGGGGGYVWYETGCCCNPYDISYGTGGNGSVGIVRILWPAGSTRNFPTNNVAQP